MIKEEVMPEKGFLTTDELARLLKVTKRSIYRWVKDGYLVEPIKVANGRNLWPRKEVEEWILSKMN